MTNFFTFLKSTSLVVLLATAFNLCADDNDLVLPYYPITTSSDANIQPEDTKVETLMPTALEPALEGYGRQDGEQAANLMQMLPPQPPADYNDDPFFEVQLDATSFRKAKTSHTNLIVALTQQEQRNNSNQVSGGDINSGIMRDVEQGVLSNIAQSFNAPNDPSKIAFIRLDVTKNTWIWSYFNDGTATQSVDPKNGTPQYLFFNQGNLISVLVGNRDDSAFANWVRTNTTVDDNVLPPQKTTELVAPDAQAQEMSSTDQSNVANTMLAITPNQSVADDSSQLDDVSASQYQQDQMQ